MANPLALTTSADGPAWQDAFEALAYTAFALASQGDPGLSQRIAEARAVLADWERIDADRRLLRGDAIAARAAIRIADAALDLTLSRLADVVLEETRGDRAHELYTRYFPEPHERVIALGLDAELPLASLALARLDEGEEPAAVNAQTDALRRCVTAGNQALTARAEAYAALGRLEARAEAWLEAADAFGAGLREELKAIGTARGLPARWAACFFPS